MKKISLIIICTVPFLVSAQRFINDSSYVRFFSEAPLENIEAVNIEGTAVIDLSNGQVAFSIPVKSFEFEKSLMKEHFNENYLESDKYPKATFRGKIGNWSNVPGKRTVSVSGDMTIHGKTNPFGTEGDIDVSDKKVVVKAVFPIAVADYKIRIPKAVFYNIAEVVEVTAYFELVPYEKN